MDLEAACERNILVTEVTYCNSISVAEHVVMHILALVRNYIPSYNQVVNGKSSNKIWVCTYPEITHFWLTKTSLQEMNLG